MRRAHQVGVAVKVTQRGITLVEVVIVAALASVVMLALTGFYINAQGTWIEAAAQAVTQREASLVLGTIAENVHAANSATGNSTTSTLILLDSAGNEQCRFWLHPEDSLIHVGQGTTIDRGPLATSRAARFEFTWTASRVNILALDLRSAEGGLVHLSGLAAFYNR